MKVVFAGVDNYHWATLMKVAGVQHVLFSVFGWISEEFGIKCYPKFGIPKDDNGKYRYDEYLPYLQNNFKSVIMDSGLFTLMFGAHAGKRDKPFMERWQERLIGFVKQSGFRGTVVECDCQKVLGVKEAWQFRERLRDSLPNEQVNVYHMEDRKRGLDRMIEFSDYIAISVPELRAAKVPKLPEYVLRQTSYIKNKKPSIKIHLLGCTQDSIMRACRFCDTCDSTSWQSAGRWGFLRVNTPTGKVLARRSSGAKNHHVMEQQIREVCNLKGDAHVEHLVINGLAAVELLRWYSRVAGSQE